MNRLDRLAELAREEAPPPLPPGAAEDLVSAALRAAAQRQPTVRTVRLPRRRQVALVTFALTAAAATLLVVLAQRATAPRVVSAPLAFELPAGDRVLASPGARVRVAAATGAARALTLADGSALFDVAPLGAGGGFEVSTAHARVSVRGTVFSVSAGSERTVVRVYEGEVQVSAGTTRVTLAAGAVWSSDGSRAGDDPLRDAGLAAAAARAARAPLVTALPEVTPLAPAPDPRAPPAPVRTLAAAPAADEDDSALAEVRGWITVGAAERARVRARERAAASPPGRSAAWRLVEADALRALGRHAEAAAAFDDAAAHLPAGDAAHAGYLAAALRLEREGDARGALASLDASGADAPGAPLEERALALRALALARLGDRAGAAAAARRYLDRFPDGGHAVALRALLPPVLLP